MGRWRLALWILGITAFVVWFVCATLHPPGPPSPETQKILSLRPHEM